MPNGEAERQLSVRESFANAVPAGIAGGIIVAIIGVVLSLFAIFNLGFSGLLATIVLGVAGFLIGFAALFLITFVWYLLPPVIRRPATYLFFLVLIVGLIFLAIFLWRLPLTREYLKFAEPMFDSIGKGVRDLRTNWGACLYLKPPCPFLIDWENPDVQSAKEELRVDVAFSDNKISRLQNKINLLVSLTVSNPEFSELRVKPKCYFGKNKTRELRIEAMGTYSQGDEFVFGTTASGQEFHTSFRCVGEVYEAAEKELYSDYVVVELKRPVTVKTTWPVQIGTEPHIGLIKSTMQFNAPYTIAMASNNDMPFNEGKEYDFNIVMKRRAEDVKFKELNYMNVKFSEDLMISCDGFEGLDHEIEIKDYSYEGLKNISQYDKTYEKFSWPCKIYVASAPRQSVLSPVELEAKYTLYSTYKTLITKSP